MRNFEQKKQEGFALLLSLIISSVVLAVGISMLHISINQINLSSSARESEFAFQAAHAGIDCQWYWRNEKSSEYLLAASSPSNPSIDCFGGSPVETSAERISTTPEGIVDRFLNTFAWGDPSRCTITDMYILHADSEDDLTVNFLNRGVGDNGEKICEAGNVCTVLISAGYNRACDELDSAIFSIEREITVEF